LLPRPGKLVEGWKKKQGRTGPDHPEIFQE
jgi:hypothetical protein